MKWSHVLLTATLVTASLPARGQIVSLGSSIGEGVQSGDASAATQLGVYSKLIAQQAGASHPLPLIIGSPFSTIYSTSGRFRLNPNVQPLNLAVSGAEILDMIETAPSQPVDTETDLVLLPYSGSQLEIAESLTPDLALCWAGPNDVLGAILSFDKLNASQLTSVEDFETRFQELSQRLAAASTLVAFATIPDVSVTAFTFTPAELAAFAGSDFGMPEGYRTSLVVALALGTGLVPGRILENPDYVLDPTELAIISQRVADFNAIIVAEAAKVGAPVVDLAAVYESIDQNGFPIFDTTLTTDYLGGIFSLDGVHPSNIGHAIIANEFIRTINDFYDISIPELGPFQMGLIFFGDPFIDKDQDGRVTGRPFAGLIETLAPSLGLSGDPNDFVPDAPAAMTEAGARQFVANYAGLTGNWRVRRGSLHNQILNAISGAFGQAP